jgi:uncharacterized protein (UPF0261 family)
VKLKVLDAHINDPAFADAMVEAVRNLTRPAAAT